MQMLSFVTREQFFSSARTQASHIHGIRQQACRKRISGFGWVLNPGPPRSRAPLTLSRKPFPKPLRAESRLDMGFRRMPAGWRSAGRPRPSRRRLAHRRLGAWPPWRCIGACRSGVSAWSRPLPAPTARSLRRCPWRLARRLAGLPSSASQRLWPGPAGVHTRPGQIRGAGRRQRRRPGRRPLGRCRVHRLRRAVLGCRAASPRRDWVLSCQWGSTTPSARSPSPWRP